MEEFLKSFPLSFLLRSVFSGAFFTLAYSKAASGSLRIDPKLILPWALPVSLIAGVSIYGLHRSILFPLIEWTFNSNRARNLRKEPCFPPRWLPTLRWPRFLQYARPFSLISQNSKTCLIKRWGWKRRQHVCNWADYAHLQYASFGCVIFGSLAGAQTAGGSERPYLPLVGLAILFLFAGLVSDWRLHAIEDDSN